MAYVSRLYCTAPNWHPAVSNLCPAFCFSQPNTPPQGSTTRSGAQMRRPRSVWTPRSGLKSSTSILHFALSNFINRGCEIVANTAAPRVSPRFVRKTVKQKHAHISRVHLKAPDIRQRLGHAPNTPRARHRTCRNGEPPPDFMFQPAQHSPQGPIIRCNYQVSVAFQGATPRLGSERDGPKKSKASLTAADRWYCSEAV